MKRTRRVRARPWPPAKAPEIAGVDIVDHGVGVFAIADVDGFDAGTSQR
jgi:hypothetical protein